MGRCCSRTLHFNLQRVVLVVKILTLTSVLVQSFAASKMGDVSETGALEASELKTADNSLTPFENNTKTMQFENNNDKTPHFNTGTANVMLSAPAETLEVAPETKSDYSRSDLLVATSNPPEINCPVFESDDSNYYGLAASNSGALPYISPPNPPQLTSLNPATIPSHEPLLNTTLSHSTNVAGLDEYIRSPEVQNSIVERSPGGRYIRFMEKLGSGASKDVYRAYDTQEGIEVAWNVVNLAGVPKTERNRIVNEVRLLERLHHQNIISFHGSWVNRERQEVNFVTEILSSGTLKSFINKVQVIRWKIAKRWAVQILNGLEYLHSQDPPVIHRDLKCENIFINGSSGDLRIGDLGLSTVHRNGRVLSVLGTPEFMAPDMYEESSYDEKVDVYAFGMCMLEILTKEIPYAECKNPAQIYKKVSSGEPPDVLSRLQSKNARDFVVLCLGYKDENGKYVRPSVSELLKHPFLEKRASDDDEVMVIERADPSIFIESEGKPSLPRPGVLMKSNETVTIEGGSRVRARATSLDDSEDAGFDTFENMQESEIKMRKVKVLMGRGQELEDDDVHSPSRQSTNEDSPTVTLLPEANSRPLGQEQVYLEKGTSKQTLSNDNVANIMNLSNQLVHNTPISNNTTTTTFDLQAGQQSPVPPITQNASLGGPVRLEQASSIVQQLQFQMPPTVTIPDPPENVLTDQHSMLVTSSAQPASQQLPAVITNVGEQAQPRVLGPPFSQQLQHISAVVQDQSQTGFNAVSNQQHAHVGATVNTANSMFEQQATSYHQHSQSSGPVLYEQIAQPAAFVVQQLQPAASNLPPLKPEVIEHHTLLSSGMPYTQQGQTIGSVIPDQLKQANLASLPLVQPLNGVHMLNSHVQPPVQIPATTMPVLLHTQAASNPMLKQVNPPPVQAALELPQQTQSYLVAAAVIEDENPNSRPYADDILKLIVTLPVDGQTQNVQFDFHLVEDDPVQVAKEMVQELAIPPGAVLEISETISGLAQTARMKQDRHAAKAQQSSIHPQYNAAVIHQSQPGTLRDQMPYHQASSAVLGSKHLQHHGAIPIPGTQDSAAFLLQTIQHQGGIPGIGTTIGAAATVDYSITSNPINHINHQQHPLGLVGQSHDGLFQQPSHVGQQTSNSIALDNHIYVSQGTSQIYQGATQGAVQDYQPPSTEYSNFQTQVFVQTQPLGQHTVNNSVGVLGSSEYTQYQYQPSKASAVPIVPNPLFDIPSNSTTLEFTEQDQIVGQSQDLVYGQSGRSLPIIVDATNSLPVSAPLTSVRASKIEIPYSQQASAGYSQTNSGGEQSMQNPPLNLQVPYTQHSNPSQSSTYGQSITSSIDTPDPGFLAQAQQSLSGHSHYGLQLNSSQSLPPPGGVADASVVPSYVSQSSSAPFLGVQTRNLPQTSQVQAFNTVTSLSITENSSSMPDAVPTLPISSRSSLPNQSSLSESHAPETQVRAENEVKAAQKQKQDLASISDNTPNSSLQPTRRPGLSGSPSSARQPSDDMAIVEEVDDDSDDNDFDLVEQMKKLEEEYQRNLQRAQKVFISRMDNLQRSQVEREAQHQKTLVKHQKERADYERRLAQEEEQQNRRIEQLQREWEQKRETIAQIKKKNQLSRVKNGVYSLDNDGNKVQEKDVDSVPSSAEAV